MYLTNTVQTEMLFYFYPQRLSDNETMAAQVKAHAEQRVAAMFDIIEAELAGHAGPYLLGERYSIVDPYLLMLARWTRMMQQPARDRHNVGRFLTIMAARPAVQRAFAAEGIDAPFF
jgi:glutathione S-transferase